MVSVSKTYILFDNHSTISFRLDLVENLICLIFAAAKAEYRTLTAKIET